MALSWPTKDQIRASILALWRAERPDADSTKYSDLWLFSRVGSVLVYRLHRTIDQALNAVFPTTTFEEYLTAWLSWLGLPDGQGGFGRILPHISAADAGLECVAPGAIAPNAWNGQFLTDTAGKTYECTQNHAIGPITVNLNVESVDTGYGVNLESGTVLTWVGPPAGSDPTATLVKDLVGGTALGEDSAERARLLGRLRKPPASGNVASWIATIEAVKAGTLKAYVWPQRQNQPHGYGLTDYCALKLQEIGSDRFILAADDLYTDITDAVSAAEPALIYRNSRQLTMTAANVDVELTITLGDDSSSDQRCDWNAEGANPNGANKTTVAATVVGSLEINCVADVCEPTIVQGIEVGHKVVINGIEAEVATVNVAADASRFTVTAWPDGWPVGAAAMNTLNVTSGGGFIGWKTEYDNDIVGSGLVNTVQDYYESRGPNVQYNAAQSEIPGWDSTVRPQQIESVCFVLGGGIIVDVTVAIPGGIITHGGQDVATALIYIADEITIWQVFV